MWIQILQIRIQIRPTWRLPQILHSQMCSKEFYSFRTFCKERCTTSWKASSQLYTMWAAWRSSIALNLLTAATAKWQRQACVDSWVDVSTHSPHPVTLKPWPFFFRPDFLTPGWNWQREVQLYLMVVPWWMFEICLSMCLCLPTAALEVVAVALLCSTESARRAHGCLSGAHA